MKPFIPDPVPNQRVDHSAPRMIAALSKANQEIARYNALLGQSPGAHLLVLPLQRREATLSSRIEGSQSTFDEVLQFEEDSTVVNREQRDDINEIVNYTEALVEGGHMLGERGGFSLNLLKNLHQILLGRGSVRGKNKKPGEFRDKQVWIGRTGLPMEQATYIPPEPIFLMELMENWVNYYCSSAPDALVQVAIVHAQFELIHPFADGNGRLGRLLIPLFLCEKKVIDLPSFYLSAYLERNREAYMKSLQGLNSKPGAWDDWVLFFLRAVAEQAIETSDKIGKISDLYESLRREFIDVAHSQFAVDVLEAIFQRPIFKRASIEKMLVGEMDTPPSGATLHNLLSKLVKSGILTVRQQGSGRRSTLYALPQLLDLLNAD